MTQGASVNLATLIARLKQAGVDWDGENIADLLWLVPFIDAPAGASVTEKETVNTQETVQTEIDNTAPSPLFEGEPDLSLTQSLPPQTTQPQSVQRGIAFQTPTSPSLRRTLALGRSLRPLMRRVDSYTQMELDEDATAEQTAEQQVCMTVVQPARERWLELALVIEDSASSFLWRDTIRDFRQVLERQGAFRTITTWYLQTGSSVKLFANRPATLSCPRDPKALIDTSGRRLILVVSDCLSPAWRQGILQANYLKLWATHGPLAIVQMLPERLWSQTILGAGLKTSFSARLPGEANTQLIHYLPLVWDEDDHEDDPGLNLPVITLEPSAIAQWSRMLAGFGDAQAPGIWFDANWQEALQAVPSTARSLKSNDLSINDRAQQMVNRFNKTASPTARELAAFMALVPVELSLIYIIQAKMLPHSTPLHVAEVFLSGLIERLDGKQVTTEQDALVKQGSLFSTQRRYDFVPGVREHLTEIASISGSETVLNAVSAYIGQKLGKSIYTFTALLLLQDELTDAGEEFLEFARIAKSALRRLGGNYAAWVDAIDSSDSQQIAVPDIPDQTLKWPPIQVLEFTKGELISADEPSEVTFPSFKTATFTIATITLPQSGLDSFEFQTGTLERRRTGILRRQTWVVKKTRAQARRWVETLSDDVALEMVWIPAGKFDMGSPRNEPERSAAEGPQHEVVVPQCLMGRYPVTQAQWRVVAAMPQVNQELAPDPSTFKGDNRPVEGVSWHEATEFCARLAEHTNRPYRLPTEAEWEYACRAETTTPFHFGLTLTTEIANYNGDYTYADGPKGEDRNETTPVDHFDIANAFGLCDMHGNVWEWCQDHWHDNYEEAPVDGSAWLTEDENANRIVRGCSWIYIPGICRSAYRDDNTPDYRDDLIGFRVCCSPPRALQ
ncbi:formylglycine-generating enzyme family protein [Leptothoe sp. PORK10 BA2]|uniref:formylglycine-generating enzyme family protein n=1 Tax=Leptothoe sp. PORK10 BA2 TaxID=3110254 RepID=UPI002B1F779E|nr:formylglycine-generating enzyme family protein [Leptothoe sp. PORK10 BA2]MEA5464240.1 formylglycine-generating enzyme family protein [Leptothoe sp. PORK10 BA2]